MRRDLDQGGGGVVVRERGKDGFAQENLVAVEGRPQHRAACHAGGGGGRLVPEGQTLQGEQLGHFFPTEISFNFCMIPKRIFAKSIGTQEWALKVHGFKRWCLTRGQPTPPLLLGAFLHRSTALLR